MNKTNFDHLLHRYLIGEVSEQERIKIEAWLDIMKTEHGPDVEFSEETEERIFRKIVDRNATLKDVIAVVPRRRRITAWGWTLRVAAAVLLLIAASYVAWQFGDDDGIRASAEGRVERVVLPDGSVVWLKGESDLVFYWRGKTRYAELEGEGLFEVMKDPRYPFVINCGLSTLTVVGTSFNLKATDQAVELLVLTGKVILSSTMSPAIEVKELEKVVLTNAGSSESLRPDSRDIARITADTEYFMHFRNETMTDVVRRIEKKFNVKVTFENRSIGDCRITADFTDRSLRSTFQLISEVLDISYSIAADRVTISGRGCR